MEQAANTLEVSTATIRRWRARRTPSRRASYPNAPWRIRLTAEIRARFVPDIPEGYLPLSEAAKRLGVARQTEARRLAVIARRKARGRGATAKLKAAGALEEFADRCRKVAGQIRQRVARDPITDRVVSLSDPDARPIRKGKLGKPTDFGYVCQLAEVTENTKPGARGLILPASSALGSRAENTFGRDRLRAHTSGDLSARDHARRRVHARPD